MSIRTRWFPAAAVLAVVAAGLAIPSAPAYAESNGGVRVMPLGDSITEGTQVPGGYRIGLWQRLTANRYTVDLVGSQFNGPGSLGDHDHEGHPGWRIDQIDANIAGWLGSTAPHSVLLHIGTNDILQNVNLAGAPGRLSTLIDHITAAAPTAEVFVAQITPLASASQENAVRTFNAAIPGIVQSKVNSGRRVHLVDLHSALTAADLIDGIHPTATGYDKMAATWYSALLSVSGSIGSPSGGSGGVLTPGSAISLRATTACCTTRYLRHQNNNAVTSVITAGSPALDKNDATFIVRTGLSNGACVSFESRNFAGHFLRQSNLRVVKQANDGTATFRADATFCPQAGRSGTGTSFASASNPTRFLRHFSNTVYIASNGGPNAFDSTNAWAADVSWAVSAPWAP